MDYIREKISRIKIVAVLLCISLCIPSFGEFVMPEDANAAEIHTLQNPVIETDSSMTAGQKVTWDCIWFGSYPQAEVLTTTMEEPIDSKIQNGDDFIKDDALYQKLQNATTWDANGDTTIDGEKYRRIQKSDATYATTGSENHYNWSNEGYHYFKYQPIKWQVLETKDGKAFLLSNVSLDDKRYHEKSEAVTWATSTIRSWLNGYNGSYNQLARDYSSKNFIGTAFSTEEQQLIQSTNVINDDNIQDGTEGGEDTNDKIFLLSESEVYTDQSTKYGFLSVRGNSDEARRKKSSTFSKALGTWSNSNTEGNCLGNCWWWLRSPGFYTYGAAIVHNNGWANTNSNNVDYYTYGMCPALNLNLSSTNLYQYAGTVCSDGTVNEIAPVTSQTPVKPQPSTTVQSQNLPMATRPTNTYVSKKKQSISVKSTIVKTYSSKRFSLNARTNGNGKLTYKCSNKKVAKVLSNGTVIMKGYGKATITITASGTGQYAKASKKVSLVVHPAQGEITKIKLLANGKRKVSWKKDKLGSGYVVQICKDKKFKKGCAQRYFEKDVSSVTIQLSGGTKYYYRIRVYKRTNGVDDYGKWSKVKSAK